MVITITTIILIVTVGLFVGLYFSDFKFDENLSIIAVCLVLAISFFGYGFFGCLYVVDKKATILSSEQYNIFKTDHRIIIVTKDGIINDINDVNFHLHTNEYDIIIIDGYNSYGKNVTKNLTYRKKEKNNEN